MDDERFRKFACDQVEAIKKAKKEAEKKAGIDLGDLFIHDWIEQNSESFHEQWEKDHT